MRSSALNQDCEWTQSFRFVGNTDSDIKNARCKQFLSSQELNRGPGSEMETDSCKNKHQSYAIGTGWIFIWILSFFEILFWFLRRDLCWDCILITVLFSIQLQWLIHILELSVHHERLTSSFFRGNNMHSLPFPMSLLGKVEVTFMLVFLLRILCLSSNTFNIILSTLKLLPLSKRSISI